MLPNRFSSTLIGWRTVFPKILVVDWLNSSCVSIWVSRISCSRSLETWFTDFGSPFQVESAHACACAVSFRLWTPTEADRSRLTIMVLLSLLLLTVWIYFVLLLYKR